MRKTLLAVAVSFAALAATPASAFFFATYNAPWCAITAFDGGSDCAYYTLRQCEQTISGIGGLCEPNLRYRPGRDRHASKHHRRWRQESAR
jgi:hypothetical protein